MADADRAAAARLILDDYRGFLSAGDAADAKAFAARHAAGKAALTHLDQLMKLGAEEPGEDEAAAAAAAAGLAGYLDAAHAAMASLEEGEGAEADGDGSGG